MLRRNGKPRACEPCRISKIRCDHTTPRCDKCQARGIADQCYFHPSPMTKPPGTPRKQPERRRVAKQRHSDARESRSHERLSPIHLSPTSLRSDIGAPATCPATSTWPTPPDSATATRTTQSSSDTVRSFYLGSTSYASVFAEERPLPDAIHEQPAQRMSVSASDQRKMTGSRHCQLEIGRSIVSALTPFSLFEKSVAMYFDVNKATALVAPVFMSALPQLRKDIAQLLALGSDSYTAYGDITRNTAKPLKVPPTMLFSEFHTLFTGENLRWETLGLLFILAGSNAQFTSPDHPIFTLENGTKIDKEEFIENMIHASNDCITLCQVHGAVNDITVWLLYHNMLVTSNFYGENYHGVWRRQGETLTALYAEGIHCETMFEEPFFLCEARRRIYHAVYRSDKTLAVFLGRPPMMALRYSDRKQPLDIDDDVLATEDPEVLNAALSKLDSQGWNTDGKLLPATWIRLRSQFSLFKERFLDQSLAGIKGEDIVQKVQAISADAREFWESLPSHVRYDLYEEDAAWSTFGPSVALRMISFYLEFLHMEFQLQRLIRRQTQMALPALLDISMKLLSTVMVFNKLRNQVYDIQRHVPTIILYYCLPSAGVLALELRRCTLENVPLPDSVPRADVIRNLSVLISCLEWVILPGDGNHRLCSELNKMLALVLDEVLNYQPPPKGNQGDESEAATATEGGLGAGFFDIPMIDGMEPIPTESEDFLNWLDNANWNNTVSSIGFGTLQGIGDNVCSMGG